MKSDDVYGKKPHVFTDEELVHEQNFYWETFWMCSNLGIAAPEINELMKLRREIHEWCNE